MAFTIAINIDLPITHQTSFKLNYITSRYKTRKYITIFWFSIYNIRTNLKRKKQKWQNRNESATEDENNDNVYHVATEFNIEDRSVKAW